MAAISGKEGLVTWSGSNYDTNVSKWSATISQGSLDVTAFAATPPTSKTKIPSGIYEFSGSFEAFADDSTVVTLPEIDGAALQTITLRLKGTQNLNGTAFITSVDVSTDITDSQKVTYNFEGSGDVTTPS